MANRKLIIQRLGKRVKLFVSRICLTVDCLLVDHGATAQHRNEACSSWILLLALAVAKTFLAVGALVLYGAWWNNLGMVVGINGQ